MVATGGSIAGAPAPGVERDQGSAGGAAHGAPRDIRALTGLRAVAATLVVLFHVQYYSGAYLDSLPLLRPLVAAGWTGVELFFVLSGFVITYRYLDRLGSRPTRRAVGDFLIARVARVWPAWAVVTVAMAGWIWLLRSRGWDADVISPHPDADAPTLLRQLSMTHMWGEGSPIGASYVLPGWSISAEWAAYLAFPVIALLVRPLRRLPAVVLMLLSVAAMLPLSVVAFTAGTPDFEQSWEMRIACGFLAGVFAALAVRRVRAGGRIESAAGTLLGTSLALIAAGVSWSWWRRAQDMSLDYAGIVAVVFPLLVIALSLTERGPARWLASAPMIYGGRISYCLYLVHFAVLDVAVTLWWQAPAERGAVTPGLVLAMPGLVLVSFLLAAALHHLVEEPGRRGVLRLDRAVRHGLRQVTGRAGSRTVASGPGLPRPAVPRTSVPRTVVRPAVTAAPALVPSWTDAAERATGGQRATGADRTTRMSIVVEPRSASGAASIRVPAAAGRPRHRAAGELAG